MTAEKRSSHDPAVRYVDVVVPRTRLDELTYRTGDTSEPLEPGDCLRVPLRGRLKTGVVVGRRDRSPVRDTQAVAGLVRKRLLSGELVRMCYWTADYYFGYLGETMAQMLPRRVEQLELAETVAVPPGAPECIERADTVREPFLADLAQPRFGVWVSGRIADRSRLIRAVARAALANGSVLLLAPENQLVTWLPLLSSDFGDAMLEYRAGLGEAALREAWLAIRQRRHCLVAGTRKAVMSPIADLRCVVVVDEHDPVYKEERRPRYHARDLAIARAQSCRCPALLVTRTPSAETWYNLDVGRYRWLERTTRAGRYEHSFIVDMKRYPDELLSARLLREVEQVVAAGRSAVLYINRRGLSRYAVCRCCGEVVRCRECGVALVLADGVADCRWCGRSGPAPDSCERCSSPDFGYRAPGTEMVEREIVRRWPTARVRLVVSDASEKTDETGTVYVGTRAMIVRPWPRDIALVAAVAPDGDLIVPDFRSAERTFQVLFDLCRRARQSGARVVIQTRFPDDSSVVAAVEGDPGMFLEHELRMRADLQFPPFCRLASLVVSGPDHTTLVRMTSHLVRRISRSCNASVLGPVEIPGRKYSLQLLVKLPRDARLSDVVTRSELDALNVDWRVDVDPLDLR